MAEFECEITGLAKDKTSNDMDSDSAAAASAKSETEKLLLKNKDP